MINFSKMPEEHKIMFYFLSKHYAVGKWFLNRLYSDRNIIKKAESPKEVLQLYSFPWYDTPEEYVFWGDIYDEIKEYENKTTSRL